MSYVDLCILGENDMKMLLGMSLEDSIQNHNYSSVEQYKSLYTKMFDEFNLTYLVSTLRENYSASDNGWSALMYDGKELFKSKSYNIRIVDRVGGGDSFVGGLIYALLEKDNLQEALEFAVGASALKHTIFGSVEEVEKLIQGDSSGTVQR